MSICCFGRKDSADESRALALSDCTPPLQLLDITQLKVKCRMLQSIHRYFLLARAVTDLRHNFATRPTLDRKKEAKQLRIRREVAALQQMQSRASCLTGQLPQR